MKYYRVVRLREDADDSEEVWVRRPDSPPRDPWGCTKCLHMNNPNERVCGYCGEDRIE